MLYHYSVGSQFRFSTGIGPFQLDRGGNDNPTWDHWPTINKLDYAKASESALKYHYSTFGSGSSLASFSSSTLWYGVDSTHVAAYWNAVTGTIWIWFRKMGATLWTGLGLRLDWAKMR